MKRAILGIGLSLSSGLVLGSIILANAILTADIYSWEPSLGKFYSSLTEYKLMPAFIIMTILFFLGIGVIIKEYFSKPKEK
jgi:hypothetical protein